jgi:hypothetical protein
MCNGEMGERLIMRTYIAAANVQVFLLRPLRQSRRKKAI